MDGRQTMNGRVVVGFAPTMAGYEALRYAVTQARDRAATLVVVHAVRLDPHDSWAESRLPMTVAVTKQVTTAFHEALGGVPADLDVHVIVEAAPADLVLRAAADQPGDLLVVGSCTRRRLGALAHGARLRRTLRSAVCPVVVIPPPAMARLGSASRLGRNAVAELEHFLQQPVKLTS
jgi:nucleotide-binding universal stress UspA family protein